MKLYVARHGETDLNIAERFQGASDHPLNEQGRRQALRLAQDIPNDIEVIVSSPQLRAYSTAQAVALARRLPVLLMTEFRERDFGSLEGLTPKEAALKYPALWRLGGPYQWEEAPEGAESVAAVVTRVEEGLRALTTLHGGRTVLLVSHGFVMRAIRFLIDGIAKDEFFVGPLIANGHFMAFELVPGRPTPDG